MGKRKSYIGKILSALKSLTTGMRVTIKEFFTPKITQCYPENRETLKISDRFRGVLEMPHDENQNNKCIACSLCEKSCPNGTILVRSVMVEDPETGKKKKKLVEYKYNLGSCMYCNLCVDVCPTGAIQFNNGFENAVFDKDILNLQLNIVKDEDQAVEKTDEKAEEKENA